MSLILWYINSSHGFVLNWKPIIFGQTNSMEKLSFDAMIKAIWYKIFTSNFYSHMTQMGMWHIQIWHMMNGTWQHHMYQSGAWGRFDLDIPKTQERSLLEMFYLNTIKQLFLFVEQLFQLEVCLTHSRLLAGIPILAVFQNLRWNSNKTPLSHIK